VAQCFCRLPRSEELRLRRTAGGARGVLGGSAQIEVRRMGGRLRSQSLREPCGGALREPSGQFDGDLAKVNVECKEV